MYPSRDERAAIRQELGRAICEARRAKGKTQRELENELKLPPTTMSNIETGKFLSPRKMKKVADALGVDIPTILGVRGLAFNLGLARECGKDHRRNRLWLVERFDDTTGIPLLWISFVVIAETEDEALSIRPGACDLDAWPARRYLKAIELGIPHAGLARSTVDCANPLGLDQRIIHAACYVRLWKTRKSSSKNAPRRSRPARL
jgi:transcriptional regulator with XRE-family HTH domain